MEKEGEATNMMYALRVVLLCSAHSPHQAPLMPTLLLYRYTLQLHVTTVLLHTTTYIIILSVYKVG